MPEIPKTEKAVVFSEHNGKLEYKDVPMPKPAADELLIKIHYTGVCHTDLHAYRGDWPLAAKLPLIGGHEGAGEVVAMGDNVTGWNIGDYAGVKWLNSSCLNCELCVNGNEACCPHAVFSGYTQDGSFQQYATANAIHAARIPKGTDLAGVAPILCAGITVYKALKVANIKPGQWVCLTGAGGGLGTLAIQYARAMGFRVIGIDGGDQKAEACAKLGAEKFVDFTKSKDLIKDVQELTGGGPHAVVHLAASEGAITQSTKYVRSCGTIVLVGLPAGAVCKTDVFDQVAREVTVKGSFVGNRADTLEAIDFYSRGLVHSPYKVMKLSQLEEAFAEMQEGKLVGRIVLDCLN